MRSVPLREPGTERTRVRITAPRVRLGYPVVHLLFTLNSTPSRHTCEIGHITPNPIDSKVNRWLTWVIHTGNEEGYMARRTEHAPHLSRTSTDRRRTRSAAASRRLSGLAPEPALVPRPREDADATR